jgi:hypothetical protein
MMQRLTAKGMPVEYVSVDKKREPYDTWRMTLLERRWKGPAHSILEKEIKELIDIGHKIEHPEENATNKSEADKPSKDLCDAIVGSLWNAINHNPKTHVLTAMTNFLEAQETKALQADPVRQELARLGVQEKLRLQKELRRF